MGALTHSKLDRAVIARYFAFLVASQLIIFTLIGVIFSESHTMLVTRVTLNCHIFFRLRPAGRYSRRQKGELPGNY